MNKTDKIPMIVIFGRPGAGKTTLSNHVVKIIAAYKKKVLALDLDVCVPQWMRDNFSNGIYPNLEQRQEFASSACDFVAAKLKQIDDVISSVIVSFSFVNTDLRDAFRERFPDAIWVLMDVTDEIAKERIDAREGHFYKGAPALSNDEKKNRISPSEQEETKLYDNNEDNSAWNFAPVTFAHINLNGRKQVDDNARHLLANVNLL